MEVDDQQIADIKKNHLFMEEICSRCDPNGEKNADKQVEDQKELDKNRNIKKIELEFCDIYQQALKKLLDVEDGSNLLYLRRFFRVFLPLANTWCVLNNNKPVEKDQRLLTSSLYYRLTYIYRNCVVLSSVTAFHFQNVLMDNPLFCQKLQQKKSVKICSLGSGSASDVVGIVKVLETVAEIMNFELEVFVTIIDSDVGWKNAAMVVLSGLEQFDGAVWKISFIEADLSLAFSSGTLKAIKDADIVTMVKFASEFTALSKKRKISKLQQTFKNVTEVIRPGSMLYVLDFSVQNVIQVCGGNTGQVSDFRLIYEELCDFYTLQTSTVQKLFVQYHKIFPSLGYNRTFNAFARAWVRRLPDEDGRLLSNRISPKNRQLNARENQNSLNTSNFFKNWERRFREEMSKVGWSRRGINIFIAGHKERRSILLRRHFEKKRIVDDACDKLMELDAEGDVEENAWKEYLKAKTDLSCVRNQVYSLTILNQKCSQKRNVLGFLKKQKVSKKKVDIIRIHT